MDERRGQNRNGRITKEHAANNFEKVNTKISDLCAEDREKIANLLRTLARTTEEKECATKQLEQERALFEQQRASMLSQMKQLIKEKRAIKKSMDDCQKLINELHFVLKIQQSQGNGPLSVASSSGDGVIKAENHAIASIAVQTEDASEVPSAEMKMADKFRRFNEDLIKNQRAKRLTSDQRHALELSLHHQEQLLREKQALLQLKQSEFQKRFDYFAKHGHFPDTTGVLRSRCMTADSGFCADSKLTALIKGQSSPQKNNSRSSDVTSPKISVATALSSAVRKSRVLSENKTPALHVTKTIPSGQKKVRSPEKSTERSVLSTPGSLKRYTAKKTEPTKQPKEDLTYAQEKEMNDIVNISELLAAVDELNDTPISDSSMISNRSSNARNPRLLNENGQMVARLGTAQVEADSALLEEIFFL